MDIKLHKLSGYGIVIVLLIASFALLNNFPMPPALAIITNTLLAVFWIFVKDKFLIHFNKRITGQDDFPEIIEKITSAFKQIRTYGGIAKCLSPIFEDDLNIQGVRFFFLEESTGDYFQQSDDYSDGAIVSKDNDLIKNMLEQKRTVSMDKNSYPAGVLCVPSFLNDKLAAFFILGEKKSGKSCTESEKKSFEIIGELIATVLNYIVNPFSKIKGEYKASEQKIQEAEKQLEISNRLASIGTLTAGVTHEIRNPLAVLRSSLDVLIKFPRDQEYLKEYYSKQIKHIDRIENIIDKMLDMAKSKKHTRIPVDLNKLIEEIIHFVNLKGSRLIKEFNSIPLIAGDPEEMERVIINLAQNAVDAMSASPPEKEQVLKIKSFSDAQKVFIELSDTGCGIPAKYLSRIFDPFFTTRHDGHGLGLSIVYRIIREHNGNISVDSEEGRGTTFKIEFDAAS